MDPTELDIGAARLAPRASSRKAALEALERLLRAHVALSEHRDPEGRYGLLRPARDDEVDLIEAVFLHCGVPLPDSLRAIYRRTLGIGNPVCALPVLSVPFLRAALPDEGFGPVIVGLDAFETELGLYRDEEAFERPPFLHLGQAAPMGLTVSRSGLWSLKDYEAGGDLPQNEEFNLVFEAAFCLLVEQVLLLWANDLAGDVVRRRDLDLSQGGHLAGMPESVQVAMAHLVARRTLSPATWGDIEPLDSADLLRATRRGAASAPTGPTGSYTTVVGLPYGGFPDVADRIDLGTLLRLVPVDDNPQDANAVEVWFDGGAPVRIGFIERQDAPNYRDLPQGASAWRLRVVGRSDNALQTRLELLGPEDGTDAEDGVSPAKATQPAQGRDLFS